MYLSFWEKIKQLAQAKNIFWIEREMLLLYVAVKVIITLIYLHVTMLFEKIACVSIQKE